MATNTRPSGQVAAGAGNMQQLTVGLVDDNVDNDGMGRLKVKLIMLDGQPVTDWCRISTPNAGPVVGFYALPEKQEEVLVSYMQGNTASATVVGAVWNGTEKAPEEAKTGGPGPDKTDTGASWSTEKFTKGSASLDANDRRLWRSRSGHLFIFDDTDGAESVQIWDKGYNLAIAFDSTKNLITISNSQGDIHIRTKNDLFLEAGRDLKVKAGGKAEIETATSTKWKAGTTYDTESGTSTKMKAGTSYDVEATAAYKAKGLTADMEADTAAKMKGSATATVESSGMTEIKGSLVKIN